MNQVDISTLVILDYNFPGLSAQSKVQNITAQAGLKLLKLNYESYAG